MRLETVAAVRNASTYTVIFFFFLIRLTHSQSLFSIRSNIHTHQLKLGFSIVPRLGLTGESIHQPTS